MRIDIGKRDILWSYIGVILSMASNLIMLPFIIYYLDADMLGLWYVFASIGSMAPLFDFGFSVTFARNITYCWSGARSLHATGADQAESREPDYHLMKVVLSSCRFVYLLISGVALLLLLTVGTAYILYIARDLPGRLYLWAWLIYAAAIFLNLYYGYFAAFLRGVGAISASNQNTVIARSVQIVATIVLLAAGFGIVGASVAYLLYGTVFRLLGKRRFYRWQGLGRRLREEREKVSGREVKALFLTVWHNAWREGLISLSNYLSSQAGTLICSLYLSLAETGVYSIGVQMATAIANVASALYTAYQPALQEAYVVRSQERVRRIMSLIVVSFLCLFVLGTAGVATVIIPLLRLLKPDAVVSMPVFFALCLYQGVLFFRNCYTSYFSCTNRILYMKAFLLSALFSVGLSFLATANLRMGVWGLIGAQILIQLSYNAWAWPMKAHREMGMPMPEMAKMGWQESMNKLREIFQRR